MKPRACRNGCGSEETSVAGFCSEGCKDAFAALRAKIEGPDDIAAAMLTDADEEREIRRRATARRKRQMGAWGEEA